MARLRDGGWGAAAAGCAGAGAAGHRLYRAHPDAVVAQRVLDPDLTLRHYPDLQHAGLPARDMDQRGDRAGVHRGLPGAGYLTAYVLSHTRGALRAALLGSVLCRSDQHPGPRLRLIIVLQSRGAINLLLMDELGLIDYPLKLVFDHTGAIIGRSGALLRCRPPS